MWLFNYLIKTSNLKFFGCELCIYEFEFDIHLKKVFHKSYTGFV